ncbi:MAG TPA: toll/interleukin-1 receptor domain-containing protein [Thermoanaerobaculia bacterium]
MTQVFISYSHKDREFVTRLTADLRRRVPQVEVWYDMMVAPGESWANSLAERIESADVILSVLSPDYLESQWAQQEAQVALLRTSEKHARFIPLLVRPCHPSGLIAHYTWVDFTTNYDDALESLIWGLTGEKPLAARGAKPGTTATPADSREIDGLRDELRAAVALFKSRVEDVSNLTTPREPAFPSTAKCFIVMPFGDADLQVVYEHFVKPAIQEDCHLRCERGDDVFGSNAIMDDILRQIESADIIVADLTRKNANVFYEVGIGHALKKRVLLLAQSIDDVPFDLRHRRILLYEYTPLGCKNLIKALKENVLAVLSGA